MVSTQDFLDKNVHKPEGALKRVEGIGSVSLRCPHCQKHGIFLCINNVGLKYQKEIAISWPEIIAAIYVCPNNECRGCVTIYTSGNEVIYSLPREKVDFDASDIPENLVATLSEAISCHSVGAFRASAMMVRRMLEELCEHEKADGKTLHDRIEKLRQLVILPVDIFDAMTELKALGNDAAHVEAREYDNIGKEEAEDCIEIAKEILKARFQFRNFVRRLKARQGKNGDAAEAAS